MALTLRTEDLSWRELDGEAVVLDLRSSTYFRANRTGTILLKALVEGCQRSDLVQILTDQYGLDPGQAADDADAFLATLQQRQLLV